MRVDRAEARERFRRRRQAGQERRAEERPGDEQHLAADEDAQDARRRRSRSRRAPGCAPEPGCRPREVDGRDHDRPREEDQLEDERLAVGRVPERAERREVLERGADARGDEHDHAHERDLREARHDGGQRGDAQLADARAEHEQPDEPADPERARGEVDPVDPDRQPLGARLRRVAREPGNEERGARRGQRSREREQRRNGSLLAIRDVEPDRDPAGDGEQGEHDLEVDQRAPEV